MSGEANGNGPETADARLSALIDGELGAAEEAALRAEIASSPTLAARLEELRSVDTALRALPEPAVSADAFARLCERLAAEGGATPAPDVRVPAGVSPARRAAPRRRRFAPALLAAAAAAALALLVLPRLREAPAPDATPLARRPEPEATRPDARPEPAPGSDTTPSTTPPPIPAPEELALALAVETEDDYEVIEMLEWLETLGEIESS